MYLRAEFCTNSFLESCSLRFCVSLPFMHFILLQPRGWILKLDSSRRNEVKRKGKHKGEKADCRLCCCYSRVPVAGGICCLGISSPEQGQAALLGRCLLDPLIFLMAAHAYIYVYVQGSSPPFHSLLKDNWRMSQRKEQLAGSTNGFREGSPRELCMSLLTKWQPAKRFTKHILADGLLLPITKDRCNSTLQIHKHLSFRNCTVLIIKQKSPLNACILLALMQTELWISSVLPETS